MKKITIIVTALFGLLSFNSFAASAVTSKNEVSIPCYDSGLGFGLAGFYTSPSRGSDSSAQVSEHYAGPEFNDASHSNQTDYK